MDLKREPIRRADPARYPSLDEVRTDRRRFLQVLGGSVAALGLAACESALEPIPNVDTGGVTSDAALPDVTEAPDVPPDTGPAPDVVQPGPDVGADVGPDVGPDVGEEPPIDGDLPAPWEP